MGGDQPGLFQLLEVHLQQGAADAQVAGELRDVDAAARQGREHAQPVGAGQRGEDLDQPVPAQVR